MTAAASELIVADEELEGSVSERGASADAGAQSAPSELEGGASEEIRGRQQCQVGKREDRRGVSTFRERGKQITQKR